MKIYAKVRVFGEIKSIIIDQTDLIKCIERVADARFYSYDAEVISMVVDNTVELQHETTL